jgi:hypothetical protein
MSHLEGVWSEIYVQHPSTDLCSTTVGSGVSGSCTDRNSLISSQKEVLNDHLCTSVCMSPLSTCKLTDKGTKLLTSCLTWPNWMEEGRWTWMASSHHTVYIKKLDSRVLACIILQICYCIITDILLYSCEKCITEIQILFTLNLLDITSKFHIIAVFVIVDLHTLCST